MATEQNRTEQNRTEQNRTNCSGSITFVKGGGQSNGEYCKIVIALFILAVIPLIIISFYNHPSADDFGMGANTRNIYLETHSVKAVIAEAIRTSISLYRGWGGIYTAAFFQALQPAIFGEEYYAVAGISMIAILILGNVIASLYFVEKIMGGKRLCALCVACFVSFAMLEWMPVPVEGIYWYDGAVNYTPCHTGLMMLLCLMTEIQRSFGKSKRKTALLSIAVVITAFFLGGGNQMCSFSGALAMFIIASVSIYVKKDKRLAVLDITLFFAMFAFFCLNVLAPGTAVRLGAFKARYTVIKTILLAAYYGKESILNWFTFRIVYLLLLSLPIVAPIAVKFCKRSTFSFRLPALVLVASIGWICALFCPSLYSTGSAQSNNRVGNYVYYSFVALLFFNEIYLAGFLYRKGITRTKTINALRKELCKTFKESSGRVRLLYSSILAAAVLVMLTSSRFIRTTSTTRAVGSLCSGKAKRYSDEVNERVKIYSGSKGKDVAVREFSVKPGLLFFDDIQEDTKNWRNGGVANYYGLKSVKLIPADDE